ncbi:MAG: sigma-54-dependent Fis family transcriptional regulator [Lentisphaerae bacterium]|nr:sigma-54-dependent Fis family transcriptional regulator [Lentisphaerota bacterium]
MQAADYSDMTVVLIDDEPMVLRSLTTSLTELGFAITPFQHPLKALDWIRHNGADIVIADIFMPECDGFEVLKQVKEIDPDCELIFITAHGHIDIAIRALREGAADFFEKPFTPHALQAAIERTARFRILARQRQVLAERIGLLQGELLSQAGRRAVMLGQSPAMKKVAEEIVNVAAANTTVLIAGESGTGKELVANAIHQASPRRDRPMLTLNCASIPEDLFESEMFGHRRGAFTGAVETRGGYIEAAAGGTIFLDEIGDMPLGIQAKVLRVIEQKTFLPVGERREKEADVRIIAATNQDLEARTRDKLFREDLYYRLNVCAITCPPLRARMEDMPMLALYFALQFAAETGKRVEGIDDEAFAVLAAYDYPGNVRELRNIVESSIIHCRHDGLLRAEDVAARMPARTPETQGGAVWPMASIRFADVERRLYEEALKRAQDNVSAAARLLGVSRGKLRRRLAALHLQASDDA